MKILQMLTELGAGGAEKVVLNLSRELVAKGHEATVVSLAPPPANKAIPEMLAAAGVRAVYAGVEKRSPWKALSLFRIVAEEAPDIVHSHLMHPNLAARMMRPFNGIPLLNTVHIADRRRGMGPWFLLDRLSFRLCSRCTAVSRAAAGFHEAALGLKPGSIEVVYNGCDAAPDAAPELLAKLRAEWRLEGASKVIGSVGRLDFQKGYDILLGPILPSLSKRIPEGERWALLIIGEGSEGAKLEALAKDAPSNIDVRLPGFRPDAPSLMGLFDAFAMPSRYEGYGLTLTEAMSLGLPVVCSRADSLPELCEGYANGACVDFAPEAGEEAAKALAEAVMRPRSKPRTPMSVAGMADAYLRIYEGLLKRS